MEKISDTYKHLYHYTTWEGLQGILESRTLWATHFKFLNDNTEMALFMSERLPDLLFPVVLEKYQEFLNENPQSKKMFEKDRKDIIACAKYDTSILIKSLYDPLQEQIYVSSFCGESKNPYINENGLLSQWRAYGKNGGFAIVLDTEKLEEAINIEHNNFAYGYTSIADVVYNHKEDFFTKELSTNISDILKYVGLTLDSVLNSNKHKKDEPDGYSALLGCITRYKHQAFAEENEIRIVTHLLTGNLITSEESRKAKEVKFRAREDEQVPYIVFFEGNKSLLPIKKIIVGPQNKKEQKQAYLRTLLRDTDIEVTLSDIPYVGK